jgi:hypothetical protein
VPAEQTRSAQPSKEGQPFCTCAYAGITPPNKSSQLKLISPQAQYHVDAPLKNAMLPVVAAAHDRGFGIIAA